MRFGLLGTVLVILLVAALLQNVAIGGIGGLILLIFVIMLLLGRV